MLEEGKFGLVEAVSVTTILIITKIFYTGPVLLVKMAGTAAWYMILESGLVAAVLFLVVCSLIKRFPGKNLVQIAETVTGKVVGKAIALLLSGYILYYAAMNMREFLEILKSYVLPYTPPSMIFAGFMAVALLLAYFGLEVIARVSYISIYPIILGLIVLLVLAYTNYNPDNLKPFFGYGLGRTIYTGIFRSSAYTEVMLLALMLNVLGRKGDFKRAGLISLILSGTVFAVCILFYTMAFGYIAGRENLSGLFQLSRIIYLSRFIQRVESLFLFIWILASVITVSASFYVSVSTYCKVFNIRDHKPLVFIFSIILFTISILPKNLTIVTQVHMKIIRHYSGIWIFGIPILLLVLSFLTGKSNLKREKDRLRTDS